MDGLGTVGQHVLRHMYKCVHTQVLPYVPELPWLAFAVLRTKSPDPISRSFFALSLGFWVFGV